MTIYVEDYLGRVLRRGEQDMWSLMAAARQAQLPLLSCVDEYDDTVFNRLQLRSVAAELAALPSSDELQGAVEELRACMSIVETGPPHLYLVFNGD